jgi:biotin transport system substrate-specific component
VDLKSPLQLYYDFRNNVFYNQIPLEGNPTMTTLAPTITTRYFPRVANWLRDLALITLGALFVAALAQVKIALPFTPIPLTGQTFAVLLVGATLGSKRGVASMALYIALGALGLPVLAGGASGITYLSGATLGYLIGFVMAAYVIGLLAERGLERSVRTSFVPFLIGTVIIYACGVTWLAVILGSFSKAIAAGLLPFLIGDAIKLIAASVALPVAWKLVRVQ